MRTRSYQLAPNHSCGYGSRIGGRLGARWRSVLPLVFHFIIRNTIAPSAPAHSANDAMI